MAEDFARWLQRAVEDHGVDVADKPTLIIGVTGKSETGTEKGDFLDQLMDRTVFCGTYNEKQCINISAYYSEYHQIVFLYLNSYNDGDVQEQLFLSNQSFFEVLQEAESAYVRHLFVLFVLSHIVIFVQPDLRSDTTLLRQLMSVNELRVQRRHQLISKLSKIPGFSSIWRNEGRIALPRLIFIFHHNRLRRLQSRLSVDELVNYLDRVERTREYQLVHMMKRTQLCAEHLGIALASLTPHRIPFVHIIQPGESETSLITDTISSLFRGILLYNDLKPYLQNQICEKLPTEKYLSASDFLLGHVKDIIKNDNKSPFYFVIPKLRTFVQGARAVMETANTDEIYSQQLIKDWLSEELHFTTDYTHHIGTFAIELYSQLAFDKKIGLMFYDTKLTEARHRRVLQHVLAFLKMMLLDYQLKLTWPTVLKNCNSRFMSRQTRCKTKSISGTQCILLAHDVPAEYLPGQSMEDALNERSLVHCSGYSYVSTCNCGKSQRKRCEPFTAKEANYDFYTSFSCCTRTESMPFRLYNPGIKWDISRTTSVTVRKRDRPGFKEQRSSEAKLQFLSRKSNALKISINTEEKRHTTYTVIKPKSESRIINELLWQYNKMMHKHEGRYLPHMWHTAVTNNDLTPLYPSWSVACIGLSKNYVHLKGLSEQPNFVKGSEFLLPLNLNLVVKSEPWSKGMKQILNVNRLPWRHLDRNVKEKTHKEKLKFFIGFEYECPLGHRFMCEKAQKILMHDVKKGPVRTDANELVSSNLPLYVQCKCSSERRIVHAQLMRLHIVTPKVPVCVKLNPLVTLDNSGYFHMGQTAELNWGRYYILRFPFVYEGPEGLIRKPGDITTTSGTLLANCIQIYQQL